MSTARAFHARSILAIAILTCPLLHAADRGWYVGAGYTSVSGDYEATPMPTEPMPTEPITVPFGAGLPASYLSNDRLKPLGSHGYKLLAGYRALDWLAIEADFTKFSGASRHLTLVCVLAPCPAELRSDANAGAISLLALYPFGNLDLFVHAGVSHWDASIDVRDTGGTKVGESSGNGTDASFGGGLQFHVKQVTARFEYLRLNFGDDAADTYSIGIGYSFR